MNDEIKTKKELLEELRLLREQVRKSGLPANGGGLPEVAGIAETDDVHEQRRRQAIMGEILGNIAHQWRQPLTVVSLLVQDISECYTYGDFNKEYLDVTIDKITRIIQQMSRSMDDFQNLLKPDRLKE